MLIPKLEFVPSKEPVALGAVAAWLFVELLSFFFFKQKTAYEVPNDWSSDVCSSDLLHTYFVVGDVHRIAIRGLDGVGYADNKEGGVRKRQQGSLHLVGETERCYHGSEATCKIGRASCRDRGGIAMVTDHFDQERARP